MFFPYTLGARWRALCPDEWPVARIGRRACYSPIAHLYKKRGTQIVCQHL